MEIRNFFQFSYLVLSVKQPSSRAKRHTVQGWMTYLLGVRHKGPSIGVNWCPRDARWQLDHLRDWILVVSRLNNFCVNKILYSVHWRCEIKYLPVIMLIILSRKRGVNRSWPWTNKSLTIRCDVMLKCTWDSYGSPLKFGVNFYKNLILENLSGKPTVFVKCDFTYWALIGWFFFGPLTTPEFSYSCLFSSYCSLR